MVKFPKRKFKTCDNEQDNVPSTSNGVKKQKRVKRQYREDYIQYEFSWCGNKATLRCFYWDSKATLRCFYWEATCK